MECKLLVATPNGGGQVLTPATRFCSVIIQVEASAGLGGRMANKYAQGALGRLQEAITQWTEIANAKFVELPIRIPATFLNDVTSTKNVAARRFLWLLDQKKLPFHPLGFVGWSPFGNDSGTKLQVEYFAMRPRDLTNDAHWDLVTEQWRAIQQHVIDELLKSTGAWEVATMEQEGEGNFIWRMNGAVLSSCGSRKWNEINYWHGIVLQEPSFSEALANQPAKKE